jgi:hypothetical protein
MSWHDFTNQVLWDSPASDQIIIYPDFEDEEEEPEYENLITEV